MAFGGGGLRKILREAGQICFPQFSELADLLRGQMGSRPKRPRWGEGTESLAAAPEQQSDGLGAAGRGAAAPPLFRPRHSGNRNLTASF